MTDDRDAMVRRLVAALADLAPTGRPRTDRDRVVAPEVWLGGFGLGGTDPKVASGSDRTAALGGWDSAGLRRLLATTQLAGPAQGIRIGWAWATGTMRVRGTRVRLVEPLLSAPVRVRHPLVAAFFRLTGDLEVTPLVRDRSERRRLEAAAEFGGGGLVGDATDALIKRLPKLNAWIADVLTAAGLPHGPVLPPSENPLDHVGADGLKVVAGLGLYLAARDREPDVRSTLLHWAGVPDLGDTALGEVYWPREAQAAPPVPDRLRTALPLTQAQREVVRASRNAAVSVVSGAPGNGKTHAAVAAAVDAVARGERVLVATKTMYAAEVIADFLERTPGPTPVVFGSSERREALARELAEGTASAQGVDTEQRAEELARVEERLRAVYATIAERLELERSAAGADDALIGRYRVEVPRAFDRDVDLDATGRLLEEAQIPTRGWWSRRRSRRLHRKVRQRLGVDENVATETLEAALGLARSERALMRLATAPSDSLFSGQDLWAELDRVDEEAREAMGRLLAAWATARRDHGDARRAVAGLGRALRAGRGARRTLLADLDAGDLLAALPLWVGTLADIDDLLPATAGLFDVVILDEASQIDQVQWAVALLRARRALVVGDPQQLRHLSFVGDDDVHAALAAHELTSLADRVDVRRVSAFDAAAAVAPVQWLDEHHRSVPHLIEFSARRFYPRPVHLATRHPRNECVDAIELRRVDGTRLKDGTNPAEVERIGEELATQLAAGATSVGVVTPMRAQADALEQHVLGRFSLEEIEQLDLRVATVHGFQGDERDVVFVSLAVSGGDLAASRRFVEDPNLFNVMITRARQRIVVVTSVDADVGGLLGEWLDYSEHAPHPPVVHDPAAGWTAALAEELRRAGLAVRGRYPVGRWEVDLCVGAGDDAVGLCCAIHPDGVVAHVRRMLELRRSGWHMVDAYPTLWDGDEVRAALDLVPRLAR